MSDISGSDEFLQLINRLELLKGGLFEAQQIGAGKDNLKRRQLVAAQRALVEVLIFVRAFDDMEPYVSPLETLSLALEDVKQGLPSPLFAPDTKENALSLMVDRRARAAAVAAVDIAAASGKRVKVAIKDVCNTFNKAGVRIGRNRPREVTVSALRSWRSNAGQYGDDNLARTAADVIRQDLEQNGAWPPSKSDAEEQVKRLAALAASRF